ncbi:MAG: prephenate dehydratase domain-containing protein [Nanoarchaeota archaeon]|nr:prephenate dehydratase domain-containing protein [Nanoarchaeota archaeon]
MAEKKKIAVLGQYSYSHITGQKVFPNGDFLFCHKIENIYDSVSKGEAELGVAPIENMLQGSVRESIYALNSSKLKILSSYDLPIHHCLASLSSNFKKVISHPQALGQCSKFFSANKKIQTEEVASTSKAMEIASKNPEYAAIGSKEAAKFFNLAIIKDNLEDNHNNVTRFILISKKVISQKENNLRTSLMIIPHQDKPGLLFNILKAFKDNNINLTKIESLPLGKKLGEYEFFMEIDGSEKEVNVSNALKEISKSNEVHSFGSYPLSILS